jgi:hypothetical protein
MPVTLMVWIVGTTLQDTDVDPEAVRFHTSDSSQIEGRQVSKAVLSQLDTFLISNWMSSPLDEIGKQMLRRVAEEDACVTMYELDVEDPLTVCTTSM